MKYSIVPLSLILSSMACAESPQYLIEEQAEQAPVQKCYLQYEAFEDDLDSDESYQNDAIADLENSSDSEDLASDEELAAPARRVPAARAQKQPQRAVVQKNARAQSQGQKAAVQNNAKAQNERSYAHPRPLNQRRKIADGQESMPMNGKQPMVSANNQQSDFALFNDKNFPGFYMGADFIYWKAEEEGLEYAVDGLLYNGPAVFNSEPSKGKIHTPHFEWEPGFKVQIGYCSDEWAWDTFLNWTWLHSDAEGKAKGPNAFNNKTVYSIWNPVYYYFGVSKSIESDWELHYNTLDWMLARAFCIGKHFSLKPMAGVRAAWIDQDYNLDYHGVAYPGAEMHIRNDGDFKGAGVMGGISASWYFTRHFSFFGDAAFSLIYGHTEATVKVARTIGSTIDQTVVHFESELNSIKPEIEAGLGFRYETDVIRKRYHLALDVKWEYLNWFDMNPFLIPLTGTSPTQQTMPATIPVEWSGSYGHTRGNLGMMGLTVGAKFTF
ncbi:MAG: hypothetical protein JSS60_00835 [Verrucomicrobia bacterium]|nr:hypothetical protein [Verrucomicrobiota bacterium]